MSNNGKSAFGSPTASRQCSGTHDQAMPKFGLTRDQWGQLTFINAAGEKYPNVAPVALFPISQPELWISIRSPDGTELVCIEDLEHGAGSKTLLCVFTRVNEK